MKISDISYSLTGNNNKAAGNIATALIAATIPKCRRINNIVPFIGVIFDRADY